jgi:hypothetical protein
MFYGRFIANSHHFSHRSVYRPLIDDKDSSKEVNTPIEIMIFPLLATFLLFSGTLGSASDTIPIIIIDYTGHQNLNLDLIGNGALLTPINGHAGTGAASNEQVGAFNIYSSSVSTLNSVVDGRWYFSVPAGE